MFNILFHPESDCYFLSEDSDLERHINYGCDHIAEFSSKEEAEKELYVIENSPEIHYIYYDRKLDSYFKLKEKDLNESPEIIKSNIFGRYLTEKIANNRLDYLNNNN